MRIYLTLSFLFIALSGFSFINRGRVDSLKTLLESSLKMQTDLDTVSINRLNKLAANYFESNPDSTIYYGQMAVSMARKIKYQAGIADGLQQTANANYFRGKFKQSRDELDEAVLIYKKLKDIRGLSNCYTIYGRMYNLLAEYKLALIYLNLSLEINKKLKNELATAVGIKNIGLVYFSEGKHSSALDYYYKALFIDIKIHNNDAAAANYNDIALILKEMELYPKALEYYKNALKMFQTANNLNGVGTVYENIAELLIAQRKYDRAINYLNKSIQIASKQDDKDGMSSVYTDLGICYANKNQPKQALNYLFLSLQIAHKYKIVYNEAYTLIGFATIYNMQKDFKNAYKYAIEGQKLGVTLGNLEIRSNAALQLNKTLAGLGQYAGAYKMLQQYLDLKDSSKNNESIQKLTSYNLEINFADKQRLVAQQQYEKEILYQQRIKQQRLISAIFLSITMGMIAISVVYYRQKRKQQKVNLMLEEKNREVLQQKTDLDDQAQKLNDLNVLKDRLISVLAHDLRAPLSTLRGLFSLLQDETITHEQMLDMIPNVLKKLEYTSDFLDTLLFWINSQMENFENSAKNFYVKDIVAFETESYHEQAALKGINLVDNVPEDVVVSADPNSIRIVIRNLITNAIKFSKENDTIEITALHDDEHNYIISVKDTGVGMSNEQLNKLFKTKVNSKAGTNNESGTGMGMLFCKDLIEKCSGKIWVTSEQGEGTQFYFTLPIGVPTEVRYGIAS